MKALPKTLYKYCDSRGIDILLNRRLKVTPFNKFNDPFELAPRMRTDFPLHDAHLMLSEADFLLSLYRISVQKGDFVGSFDEFRKIVREWEDVLAARAVEDYPREAAKFRMSHMELFAKPPVYQVEYKQECVLMGHWGDLRDVPYRSEIINALIRTKSPDWLYEREWRQLHVLSECLSPTDSQSPTGDYYKVISPSAASEVITGCRCDIAKINELLSAPEFQHIKCRQARLHDTDFKLVLEDGLN